MTENWINVDLKYFTQEIQFVISWSLEDVAPVCFQERMSADPYQLHQESILDTSDNYFFTLDWLWNQVLFYFIVTLFDGVYH